MKTTTSSIFLTAFLAMTFTGKASTIPFLFSSPYGTLGVSQTYTNNGLTTTAEGYSGISSPYSVGTPVHLYGKNLGGDESGL